MRPALVLLLSLAIIPLELRAQAGVRCSGQTIREVTITTRAPFVPDVPGAREWLAGAVNSLHSTTEPDVVRNFLLFREGEPCDELRRSESERILTAQPFLAGATIRVVELDSTNVRLVVSTVDEVTLLFGISASFSDRLLRGLRVGDRNLKGKAIHAELDWRDGGEFRDGYGVRLAHGQLFRRPVTLAAEARVRDLGSLWTLNLTQPFLTDLQRFAWEFSAGYDEQYLRYEVNEEDTHAIPTTRQFGSIGALVRIGVPGRLSLFGASLTTERSSTHEFPVRFSPFGTVTVPDVEFEGHFRDLAVARASLLWGVRNLAFDRVAGFDALSGVQDMREGFEVGLQAGRSLALLGTRDEDMFLAADLYAGGGSALTYLTFHGRFEARKDLDLDAWDGILGFGRARWYVRPHPRHTVRADVEWSGGWRTRVPYQVTLRDPVGGLRGFRDSRSGGAIRLVGRLEERYALGQRGQLFEYGVAGFVEAGRLWSGDVPHGTHVPWQASVGLGIVGAYPVGSQRVWQLDFAVPITREGHGGLEVRLSTRGSVRRNLLEPVDVSRSRERALRPEVFSWP